MGLKSGKRWKLSLSRDICWTRSTGGPWGFGENPGNLPVQGAINGVVRVVPMVTDLRHERRAADAPGNTNIEFLIVMVLWK